MKERSPAMQFYFRQFAGDENVMTMDLDAVGAHILLMCAAGASDHGYRLAYDKRAIRTLLRNPPEQEFERILTQLLAGAWKISEDGKWIVQSGMRKTLLKQKEFSQKQKDNAERRWRKIEASQKDAKAMPKACSSSSSTSANIEGSKDPSSGLSPDLKKEIKKPENYIDLAPGIWMTAEARKALREEFGNDACNYYLKICSDWLLANGKRKKDGAAFMRNWMRKDIAERKGFYYPKPREAKGYQTANGFRSEADMSTSHRTALDSLNIIIQEENAKNNIA